MIALFGAVAVLRAGIGGDARQTIALTLTSSILFFVDHRQQHNPHAMLTPAYHVSVGCMCQLHGGGMTCLQPGADVGGLHQGHQAGLVTGRGDSDAQRSHPIPCGGCFLRCALPTPADGFLPPAVGNAPFLLRFAPTSRCLGPQSPVTSRFYETVHGGVSE